MSSSKMAEDHRQLILGKLETFHKLERRATDEVGWIALQFSCTRREANSMIIQAREARP